jgi:3-phosphoshikimate 1-carboxyvinyltransferase
MNYKIVAPKQLNADTCLPASKSISNRALIINALSGSDEILDGSAQCDDTDAMVIALSDKEAKDVNIGAAGTAMRFLTAYFSVQEGREVVLDGSERMRHRPIKILVEALCSCGACIDYIGEDGFPPLHIKGTRLIAKEVSIQGNVSSQYISALLMIAPMIEGLERVNLTGEVISRPYIDMTLSIMRKYGVNTKWEGNSIVFENCAQYNQHHFLVEGDWSASSYWFEITALMPKSHVTLHHLFTPKASLQGDSAVAKIFKQFGVELITGGSGSDLTNIEKEKTSGILNLDLRETPDLAQTVVVTACMLDIPFQITGLQTLKIKETDRIEALRTHLLKMGYVLSVGVDLSLSWDGTKCDYEKPIRIDTFDDHRMAMAFAPASVKFPGLIINDIEVVSKSYPNYWKELRAAGFILEEVK